MSVDVSTSRDHTEPSPTSDPAGGSRRSLRLGSEPWTVSRVWASTWPKLVALGLVIGLWQLLFLSHWRPDYILPDPATVGQALWDQVSSGRVWSSAQTTMRRAVNGYALALVIGTLLGIAVVQWKVFRLGVGSLIAGMQTMPSIAWFPLAVLFFGTSEKAMMFVVILGAAPSIASGVISGIDEVPPPLLRAGKMLGARGINRYRYVVLPAAMPAYVQGMKQGWAFAWRSLLAGELIVQVPAVTSIGGDLNLYRQNGKAELVIAMMIVILVIGMIVDGLFTALTRHIRVKRGLTGMA